MTIKIIAGFVSLLLLCSSVSAAIISSEKISNQSLSSLLSTDAPIADAGGPYQGVTNSPVFFNGSKSYDPDGYITSFTWYCGDGFIESGETPTHIYKYPGTYTLLLTVIYNEEKCSTDITTVTIINDDYPTIRFTNPSEQGIYYWGTYLFPINQTSILIGPSQITVEAIDDVGIQRVEFYIDDILKQIDYEEPYSWTWSIGILQHNLKAVAYDISGHQNSTEQPIFKWRFHPLLILSSLYVLNGESDKSLFDWINKDNERTSLFLRLIQNLINNDKDKDRLLRSFINDLRDSKNQDIYEKLLQFLNNHPALKLRFIEQYPFMYIFLILLAYNSDSLNNDIFDDSALMKILTGILLLSIMKENLNPGRFSFLNDIDLIQWIKEHPITSLVGMLLLYRILNQRSSTSDPDDYNDTTTENKIPHANAGGPYQGVIDDVIEFNAEKSYDEDGTINSFQWNFGDGTTGSGKIVTHQYDEPDIYTVTLTVKDMQNGTDTDTIQVTITAASEPAEESIIENNQILIISGAAASVMIIGVALLKFRRKLFF